MFVEFINEKYSLLFNTTQIVSVTYNEAIEITTVLYLSGSTQDFEDVGDEVTGISIYSTLYEALMPKRGDK